MAVTVLEVDLSRLTKNARIIKKDIKAKHLMAILKANAYGHGVGPVARAVLQGGADHIGVARIEEAEQLRNGGVVAPILILGKILPEEVIRAANVKVEITLSDPEAVEDARKVARLLKKPLRVQLKVDSGMGRQGFLWEEAKKIFPQIFKMPELKVTGIFTHFSCADTNVDYTRKQYERFQGVLEHLKKVGIKLPLVHAANSGGFLRSGDYHLDMVRTGIGLYGYSSVDAPLNQELKPALAFKSKVISVRDVPAQMPISYDALFSTQRYSRLAVVAAGYADGVPKELANRGKVLIRGKKYPIVGAVCMDQIIVDVTDAPEGINPGDEVVIYGRQGRQEILLQKTAELIGRTPYELCCYISARVPRVYKV